MINSTNYGISYELNKLASEASLLVSAKLEHDIEQRALFNVTPVTWIFLHFNLYSGRKGEKFMPAQYPGAVKTRHLPRLQEFHAECNIDWTEWNSKLRVKANLSQWPSIDELVSTLSSYARVMVVQAAVELGNSLDEAAPLLSSDSPVPLATVGRVAARKRKARLAGKPNRKAAIPLEVIFPDTIERSKVRDLLEATALQRELGHLEGCSSGPAQHEVGFMVKDVQSSARAFQDALVAAGYDASLFTFEAED